MQIEHLTLQHFRGYERASFDFHPGMNLLVGVNGVGKSTVLEVLRLLFSHALPNVTASKDKPPNASVDDIMVGQEWLYAAMRFRVNDTAFEEDMRIWRHPHNTTRGTSEGDFKEEQENFYRFRGAIDGQQQSTISGSNTDVAEQLDRRRKELQALPKELQRADVQSPAVFFSAHRSLINIGDETKRELSIGGQASAFVGALNPDRQLKVAQFARWWIALEAQIHEPNDKVASRATAQIQALKQAVTNFLDNFTDVHAVYDPRPTLLLNKANTTLDVRQLSDGERSMVALVLDIARRLAQANPKLDEPIRDGRAVVLIDELDLHLHPRWQRSIVQKLTETFPKCQFIATTHSPQIIGEVEPENIILLENGKQPYRPDQSIGMDSNWVLQILMDTPDRNVEIAQQLENISDMIDDEEYEQAASEINRLREKMPDDPELVRLQVRLDRLQMLGEE